MLYASQILVVEPADFLEPTGPPLRFLDRNEELDPLAGPRRSRARSMVLRGG
jgi:hypothetical protein